MSVPNPRFETYFAKPRPWRDELNALREILLECDLEEELKWRQPCYTFAGGNVVILGTYKSGATLGFFKGVLLPDPKNILAAPGPNSHVARVMRFTSAEDIKKSKATLKSYIRAAIKLEASGAKVDFSVNKTVKRPAELEAAFKNNAALKKAFDALTPGRQRGWILHFGSAKQSATRAARIAKAAPQILKGLGIHDEYKTAKRAKT